MTHREEADVVYRQLPVGKHYHIFISYRDSEEDRPWVRELISNLQNRYKFRCCDHAIDFEPGKKIIDNIKEAITKSKKTLIILSEGYQESYWCGFEIEYALWMNMDLKEQILIPVLKEDCEIPDYLKPITYIDAGDNDMDRWLPKLVCAIESKDKNYSHQALTYNEAFPTGYGNLEILHEEKTNFNCCGPVFQSRYVPHTLQRIGSSLYSDIMNRVASTVTVEGRHCRNIWLPTMIFFIITAVPLGGLGIAMLGETSNSEQIYNPIAQAGIVLTILFAVMMFVWIPICCYTHYKGHKQINLICLDNNRKLMKHNMMMSVVQVRVKAEVKVLFIYYNSYWCLEYIKKVLKNNAIHENGIVTLPESQEMNTPDSWESEPLIETSSENESDEEATSILLNLSVNYLQDFVALRLDTAATNRHTTMAMCICQYAEAKGVIKEIVQV